MSWIFNVIMILMAYKSSCSPKNHSFDAVTKRIVELKPSKICILASRVTVTPAPFNDIHVKITREIPTFIMVVNKTKIPNESQIMMNTRLALNSDLFVFVESVRHFDVQKIKENLYFIVKYNFSPPRAKFLLVLIGDSSLVHIHLKKLFIDAWEMKFLDFSILIVHDEGNPIIRNYNPFFKTYHRAATNSGQLFPDKLANMNGYRLKTLLYRRSPHLDFTNDTNKITVSILDYGFWKLTTDALNFTLDFTEIHAKNFPVKEILNKIEKNEIDVSINPNILGLRLPNYIKRGALLIGKVVREADVNLVAPILYVKGADSEIYLTIVLHMSLTTLSFLL